MRNALNKTLGWALIIFAAAVSIFGIWAIVAYVWGVIDVLDEPDQSWIFWGLAFLFIGVFAVGTGIGLFVLGREKLRASGPAVSPDDPPNPPESPS